MTLKTFYNKLLVPTVVELGGDINNLSPTDVGILYDGVRSGIDTYAPITKRQYDCYFMAYDMKMTQQKIAEFLKISQPTVNDHIKKGSENLLALTKTVYKVWSDINHGKEEN